MANDKQCPGCGKSFSGERGLRTHQTGRYTAMGCKPVPKPEPDALGAWAARTYDAIMGK